MPTPGPVDSPKDKPPAPKPEKPVTPPKDKPDISSNKDSTEKNKQPIDKYGKPDISKTSAEKKEKDPLFSPLDKNPGLNLDKAQNLSPEQKENLKRQGRLNKVYREAGMKPDISRNEQKEKKANKDRDSKQIETKDKAGSVTENKQKFQSSVEKTTPTIVQYTQQYENQVERGSKNHVEQEYNSAESKSKIQDNIKRDGPTNSEKTSDSNQKAEKQYEEMLTTEGGSFSKVEVETFQAVQRDSNLTALSDSSLESQIHIADYVINGILNGDITVDQESHSSSKKDFFESAEVMKEEWLARRVERIENESMVDGQDMVSIETDKKETDQEKSNETDQDKDNSISEPSEQVNKDNIVELICEMGNCVSREQYSSIYENLEIYSAENLYDNVLNYRVDVSRLILDFAGANKEGLMEMGLTPEDLELLEKNLQTLEKVQQERKIAQDNNIHEFTSLDMTERFVRILSSYEIDEAVRFIQENLPQYNIIDNTRYDDTGQISNELTESLNKNLTLLMTQRQRDKDGSEPIFNDFHVSHTMHLQNVTATLILPFQSDHLNYMTSRVKALIVDSNDAIERFNEDSFVATISDFLSGADLVDAKEIVSKWSSFDDLRKGTQTEIAKGNVEGAQWRLDLAQDILDRWERDLSDYNKDTIIGAERAITTINVIKTGADLTFAVSGGAALKGKGFIIEVGGGALLGATDKLLQNTATQISEVGFSNIDYGQLFQKFGIDTMLGVGSGTLSTTVEKWLINSILRVNPSLGSIPADLNKDQLNLLSDFVKSYHPGFEVVEASQPFYTASIDKAAATLALKTLSNPLKKAASKVIEKTIIEGEYPKEKDFVEAVKKEFWKSNSDLIMKTIIGYKVN